MLYPVFLAQNPMVTCVLAKHNFLEKVVIFKVDACICVYVAVYLNGSMTNNTVRNFLVFIVYAKNSVTRYPNGRFVAGDLPPGVEEVNCSTLYVSEITSFVRPIS